MTKQISSNEITIYIALVSAYYKFNDKNDEIDNKMNFFKKEYAKYVNLTYFAEFTTKYLNYSEYIEFSKWITDYNFAKSESVIHFEKIIDFEDYEFAIESLKSTTDTESIHSLINILERVKTTRELDN